TRLSVVRGVLTGLIGVARPGGFLVIGLDADRDRPGLDPHASVRGPRTRPERGRLDLGIARPPRQRRGRDLLIRSPRNRQPEAGAFAGLAPDLQPAVVQMRILERDRQAQAGSAEGALASRIGTPEPVEDVLDLLFVHSDTVVADADR